MMKNWQPLAFHPGREDGILAGMVKNADKKRKKKDMTAYVKAHKKRHPKAWAKLK